ncbi:MAG: glycosyl transferase family 2 [Betaproteobacteria bacterium HGW-Betaproteobacteria-22]|nr:MAG: glycosyl transferase family 2 [Betaproteobacteria bacterium HGW-Betaproteobacteria-22]
MRNGNTSHQVSIVIPCYNDESKLSQLLTQIDQLPSPPLEVIVVDAAASKSCQNLCLAHGAAWLAAEPCRGKQLLAGAAIARGDVLWFLHADVGLSDDPIDAIERVLENGAVGGYFKFKFDRPRTWQAGLLEPFIALRCRHGIPYGDQGLFMRKSAYQQAGGHAPWPLFEEVPLVNGLRQQGKFATLKEAIFVNPRRWQHDGWWRRTWENRKLALAFALGKQPNELAKRYRSHVTNFDYDKKEA